MAVTITIKIELLRPTFAKQQMYERMTKLNTDFANFLLGYDELPKASSKTFKVFSKEKFPSVVAGETARYVKSQKRHQKAEQYRKLWCGFNNQNFRIEYVGNHYVASFPTLVKRVGVPLVVHDYQKMWIDRLRNGEATLGTVKLYSRKTKWYLAVPLTYTVTSTKQTKVMGIDVGLTNLAIASIGTNTFFVKGNQAAFVRRRYSALRRSLGRKKKMPMIRKLKNKEHRWMKDYNHKISRQIINFAIDHGVGIIHMEDLTGIRKRRTRKELGRSLHSWAFHQLQAMIQYKANLVGILVEYIDPQYTSQTCKCGYIAKENRKREVFCCKQCGYTTHADVNAAINISSAVPKATRKAS